ncbi:hypothetical protein LSTR_LSTR000053 [Laodelphax striatellus]|uniref:Uncharacterized protein n=1 Tax=Laodelphax striatellus TaxID=195883 RepID=A0A482X627_LAOST|nr:hypothetical protein LSTR_LSTR000053 [Laodelphax striatellus]
MGLLHLQLTVMNNIGMAECLSSLHALIPVQKLISWPSSHIIAGRRAQYD